MENSLQQAELTEREAEEELKQILVTGSGKSKTEEMVKLIDSIVEKAHGDLT